MVPEVTKCTVNNCFYWRDNECVAHGILVGSDEPICETFNEASRHSDKHGQGEVGACHVTKCEYNDNMYCHACGDIEVALSGGQAKCLTYEPRGM